ncbi:MAG: glycosyl hydrolase [Phycisphaerae bacterium]
MEIMTSGRLTFDSAELDKVIALAAQKSAATLAAWNPENGAPVFTVQGKYQARNWTLWTEGFLLGIPLLVFDGISDEALLKAAQEHIQNHMARHVSNIGVHDHGFNNISTYGNLRRLMLGKKIRFDRHHLNFMEMALKASGAVQAARWTAIPSDPEKNPMCRDTGYIYSFNGPHSLFSDTIRSLRALVVAWQLNHELYGENDRPINLLARSIHHGLTTAKYNVFHGAGRDFYDTQPGRVAHESIFNINDGQFRCPSSQQGFSPFTTWTRGLAWILLGFAEQLEFLLTLDNVHWSVLTRYFKGYSGSELKNMVMDTYLKAALATAKWYRQNSFSDGMVYWDSGAPNLPRPVNYSNTASDPFNDHEPIDSSAAAIAGQGFIRLGCYLQRSRTGSGTDYFTDGLRIAKTLFSEPYLSTSPDHQGLILHSVYHRPNGWDYIPPGRKIPCGESSLWGDYHAVELALLLKAFVNGGSYHFFDNQGLG